MQFTKEVKVQVPDGLHHQTAATFIQTANRFSSLIRVTYVKAKLFCPEIAGLFCRIAGLFCHDSRANLSLKPVCFGIAIS